MFGSNKNIYSLKYNINNKNIKNVKKNLLVDLTSLIYKKVSFPVEYILKTAYIRDSDVYEKTQMKKW